MAEIASTNGGVGEGPSGGKATSAATSEELARTQRKVTTLLETKPGGGGKLRWVELNAFKRPRGRHVIAPSNTLSLQLETDSLTFGH
jgi:hypothetical protein